MVQDEVEDFDFLAYLVKKYNKNGIAKRYTHSTFEIRQIPVYRTEHYTTWERRWDDYSGRDEYSRGGYQNIPTNHTRMVFSHYEPYEHEVKHYENVETYCYVDAVTKVKTYRVFMYYFIKVVVTIVIVLFCYLMLLAFT